MSSTEESFVFCRMWCVCVCVRVCVCVCSQSGCLVECGLNNQFQACFSFPLSRRHTSLFVGSVSSIGLKLALMKFGEFQSFLGISNKFYGALMNCIEVKSFSGILCQF